ncbi:hypothetical protein BCV73_33675 [Paenibacillus sp. SSG-1]|nr:hypothetical protein BCV73_33675 [Paenibacillus sp. SSG-1]
MERLHEELKQGTYRPMPVKRIFIPKKGKLNEKRPLGIPAIRDRVSQQALKNRLEPIFEPLIISVQREYDRGDQSYALLRQQMSSAWTNQTAGSDDGASFSAAPDEKVDFAAFRQVN